MIGTSSLASRPRGSTARGLGLAIALLVGSSWVATGCLGRSPNVDHYILGTSLPSTATTSSTAAGASSELAVGVGPVRLPAYLERAQMARLEAGGGVELSEFSRWLGGFEENFLRSLSLGLARELDSIKVVAHPSAAPFPLDYRVRLHIDDLILVEGQGVLRSRIRWALTREGHASGPLLFVLEESRPVADESAEGLVAAHEAVITELVARIARAIEAQEGSARLGAGAGEQP